PSPARDDQPLTPADREPSGHFSTEQVIRCNRWQGVDGRDGHHIVPRRDVKVGELAGATGPVTLCLLDSSRNWLGHSFQAGGSASVSHPTKAGATTWPVMRCRRALRRKRCEPSRVWMIVMLIGPPERSSACA